MDFRLPAALLIVSVSSLPAQGAPGPVIHPGIQAVGYVLTWPVRWSFTLAAASDVRAMTSPGFDPANPVMTPLAAATLNLYAPDGTTLLESNSGFPGRGLHSQVTAGNLAPGTYFLEVPAVFAWYGAFTLDMYATPPGHLVVRNGQPLPPVTNATFTAHAGGCVSPTTNVAPHLNTVSDLGGQRMERPLLGTEFFVRATGLPAGAPFFKLLAVVPLATPFDLGPLGAPGCVVEVNPIATTIGFSSGGFAFWSTSLPYNLAFRGLPLEMQVAVLDAGGNALGITTSNRGSVVVGNGY